ncbi:hypothetical protein GCM10011385_37260 [Nitratireductor aestuarii]|uniref:Solute-binding protein family 3/N-terminal domain-containing protein n=1 Tax=Nitratireductor aestuarii TaxID=1735103 RepID=A0A916WA01_9HYPH|nr:transporter substrate-binding domain-containing protein [Nitratireductor aestuarii]GGA79604.1 hypothetical protein GCM10011385_37260 [Nitratireductor aestuarii]
MGAGKIFALLLVLFGLTSSALAQEGERPYLRDENQFGRPADDFSLSFCVDPRDPSWEVDKEIGEAIARALLLEPKPFVIESTAIDTDDAQLYRYLLKDCRIHFGFKLLAQGIPDWLTVTRPIYESGYIFLVEDKSIDKLADIAAGKGVASTLGTTADLRLIQFNNSHPSAEQWRRFPYSTDEAAIRAVLSGEAETALVWAPTFSQLQKANADFAALKVIDPQPLVLPGVPVGAVLLAEDTYLRVNIDRAIGELVADGTIDEILKKHGLEGQTKP